MTAHVRTIPACMAPADYDLWDSGPLSKTDSPCRDCLPDWHLARLAEGRCDGTPGGVPIPPDLTHRREAHRLRQRRYRAKASRG
jgi:hypothetical protein